jgi:hypothetical protein
MAAGWSRGAVRRRQDDEERAEREKRFGMEKERLDLAKAGEARAASAAEEAARVAAENRAIQMHDAGFRDAAPIQGRAAMGGLELSSALFDPILGEDHRTKLLSRASGALGDIARHRAVPGVEGKLLDTEATPDAMAARAAAAKAARDAEADDLKHRRTLEEIEHRERMQRRFAAPPQPRAEPQGSIIQAEDGSYWRVVNGQPEPLTRPDGSPLRAPPKGTAGGGSPVASLIDQLRNGAPPARTPVNGDTAPAPALDVPPTPAQAAKYRELRARGVPPEQARAEAMQVR